MTALAHPLFLVAAVLALWHLVAFATAPPSWAKSGVKTGAVAALAGLGAVLEAPWLAVAGLALGALGDFFLSRPGERAFLAGMAAFAGGHLAYAALCYDLGVGALPTAPALALTVVGSGAAVYIAPRAGAALCWPVRGYIGVILAMALAALGVRAPLVTAGALLFMASDFLLALQLFVLPAGRSHRAAGYAVWALYWPAQVLILLGALFPLGP